MYKTVLSMFICLFFISPIVLAEPDKKMATTMAIKPTTTKGWMKTLEDNYFRVEEFSRDPSMYNDWIGTRLNEMDEALENIKKINSDVHRKNDLTKLAKLLKDLRLGAQQKDIQSIRKSLGRLYVSCFSCHSTHRK